MAPVLTLVLFICVPLFVNARLGPFRCDYKYVPNGEGWFKLHTAPITWNEANRICNMEGAELASPITGGNIDAMVSLMYDYDVTTLHVASRHTGNEILALHKGGAHKMVKKSEVYPYICHKKAPALVELTECGTIDDEYNLDNRTGECYKFHRLRTNWYQAARTCQIEGGELAVINSETEAQAINEVFANNPPEVIPGHVDMRDIAFIGFWKLIDGWFTVYGQSLAQAGYDTWAPGEPNNARGDEFCGSVQRRGGFFDDPCTRELPFICEKRKDIDCDVEGSTSSPNIDKMAVN